MTKEEYAKNIDNDYLKVAFYHYLTRYPKAYFVQHSKEYYDNIMSNVVKENVGKWGIFIDGMPIGTDEEIYTYKYKGEAIEIAELCYGCEFKKYEVKNMEDENG